jgi:acetoin utilization deacetylase AcuC-like enzyme
MHVFYQSDPSLHPTPAGHPERPHRLMAAASGLSGCVDAWVPVEPAHIDEALSSHDRAYLEELTSPLPKSGTRRLDGGDTIQSASSLTAALGALGGARQALDAMSADSIDKAFILARSPGHHACRGNAMGFCLLATAAWAALYARDTYGLRVAVLDFDLHHGNGTEDVLKDQEDVFFASSQQFGIWPGTGDSGRSGDFNQILNTSMPAGSGSDVMRHTWEVHLKAIWEFQPDLIIVSGGFDAHSKDPLSALQWTLDDYKWIGEAIRDLAGEISDGKVLTVLEGGYNLDILKNGCKSYAKGLSPVTFGALAPNDLADMTDMSSPYLKSAAEPASEGFSVCKIDRSLWIRNDQTGQLLYTPPSFVMMRSRMDLQHMAQHATDLGRLDIEDIILFENQFGRL